MKDLKNFAKEHIIIFQILASLGLSLAFFTVSALLTKANGGRIRTEDIMSVLIFSAITAAFLAWPIIMVLTNLYFLIVRPRDEKSVQNEKISMILSIGIGTIFSYMLLVLTDIRWVDWNSQLYGLQLHTPIATSHMSTIIAFGVIGVIGFFSLYFSDVEKTPPLRFVLSISAIYILVIVSGLWVIQTTRLINPMDTMWSWFLNLYIANIWICAAKLIGQKIFEYNHKEVDVVNLKRVTKYLNNASRWPMYAFLFMWPIMGVIIALAMLFGQDYDSIIKAWTETSDWNLSTRVAPANIQLDQHYLCTVAARGHKDFVKPIRLGYRRGNYIVVNRQLCVANAFEQLLEERTPKLHKALRSFYDKYGLPIARIIRSPFASDFVYILMKPLEWIFLGALYLFDIRPEVRIAQQYLPREDRESIKKFIESSN